MANPLKVLTQLTASKEAQFADVVEMQKTVTVSGAEAHLRVTGGGEISGSGAFKAAGAAQLGSTLDVKGASALSGALGVVGAANLQSTLGVAGIASFASDVTASAGMDIAGALHVVGAADLDSNLDVGGYAKVIGEISGSGALNIGGASHLKGAAQLDSTLDVDGAVDMDSTLDVAGVATFQSDVSASAGMRIAGDLYVVGDGSVDDFVVRGNLTVQGATTTIDTETLRVEDKNIEIANVASPTDSTADGAGITVKGATDKTFNWVNSSDAWTSSEHMDLAAGKEYRIDNEKVLAENAGGDAFVMSKGAGSAFIAVSSSAIAMNGDLALANDLDVAGYIKAVGEISGSGALNIGGAAHIAGAAQLDSTLDVDGAVDFDSTLNVAGIATFQAAITASAGLDLGGAAHIVGAVDMDSTLNVDGQADFQAAANFHNDVAMDAALNLSGSAFLNITTPVVSGKYNVNDAIRALDAKAGQQASNINSNYAALRFLETKNFDAGGMATFTSTFPIAAIEQVTVDVLVQAGGSGPWTNDLISVQVKAAGSFVGFEVSAPAMGASDKVRLIAVKESGSLA